MTRVFGHAGGAGHPNSVTLGRHGKGRVKFNLLRVIGSIAAGSNKAVTGVAATNVITSAGHAFVEGVAVAFSSLTGGAGLTTSTIYYVRDVTTNTFKVAATRGGPEIDFATDITAGNAQTPANYTRVEASASRVGIPDRVT
jgi:hypothetical protein